MGLKFKLGDQEVFVETVSEPTPERLKASMFWGPFQEEQQTWRQGSVWHVKGTRRSGWQRGHRGE